MGKNFRQLKLLSNDRKNGINMQIGWDDATRLITCPRGIFPELFESKIDLEEGASLTLKAQVINFRPTIISISTTGVDLISYLTDEVTPSVLGQGFQHRLIDIIASFFGPTGDKAYAFYQLEVEGAPPLENYELEQLSEWAQGNLPSSVPREVQALMDPWHLTEQRKLDDFRFRGLKEMAVEKISADQQIRKLRTKMTPELLKEVATVYTMHIPKGLDAVQELVRPYGPKHKISPATAARYVRQAREAGMIVDRRRNKSS